MKEIIKSKYNKIFSGVRWINDKINLIASSAKG